MAAVHRRLTQVRHVAHKAKVANLRASPDCASILHHIIPPSRGACAKMGGACSTGSQPTRPGAMRSIPPPDAASSCARVPGVKKEKLAPHPAVDQSWALKEEATRIFKLVRAS